MNSLAQIIELAKQLEAEDPIDWSGLPLHRDLTYEVLAGSVLEIIMNMPPADREALLLATVAKLVVENYVLHTRLLTDK